MRRSRIKVEVIDGMTSNFQPRINFHPHLGLLQYSWLTEPFHALPFRTRLSSFEQFSQNPSTVPIVPGTLSMIGHGYRTEACRSRETFGIAMMRASNKHFPLTSSTPLRVILKIAFVNISIEQ